MENVILRFLETRKKEGCFVVFENEILPVCKYDVKRMKEALRALEEKNKIVRMNGGWSLK